MSLKSVKTVRLNTVPGIPRSLEPRPSSSRDVSSPTAGRPGPPGTSRSALRPPYDAHSGVGAPSVATVSSVASTQMGRERARDARLEAERLRLPARAVTDDTPVTVFDLRGERLTGVPTLTRPPVEVVDQGCGATCLEHLALPPGGVRARIPPSYTSDGVRLQLSEAPPVVITDAEWMRTRSAADVGADVYVDTGRQEFETVKSGRSMKKRALSRLAVLPGHFVKKHGMFVWMMVVVGSADGQPVEFILYATRTRIQQYTNVSGVYRFCSCDVVQALAMKRLVVSKYFAGPIEVFQGLFRAYTSLPDDEADPLGPGIWLPGAPWIAHRSDSTTGVHAGVPVDGVVVGPERLKSTVAAPSSYVTGVGTDPTIMLSHGVPVGRHATFGNPSRTTLGSVHVGTWAFDRGLGMTTIATRGCQPVGLLYTLAPRIPDHPSLMSFLPAPFNGDAVVGGGCAFGLRSACEGILRIPQPPQDVDIRAAVSTVLSGLPSVLLQLDGSLSASVPANISISAVCAYVQALTSAVAVSTTPFSPTMRGPKIPSYLWPAAFRFFQSTQVLDHGFYGLGAFAVAWDVGSAAWCVGGYGISTQTSNVPSHIMASVASSRGFAVYLRLPEGPRAYGPHYSWGFIAACVSQGCNMADVVLALMGRHVTFPTHFTRGGAYTAPAFSKPVTRTSWSFTHQGLPHKYSGDESESQEFIEEYQSVWPRGGTLRTVPGTWGQDAVTADI